MSELGSPNFHEGFITAKEAGRRFRVTSDYIARLCRQGKIRGRQFGTIWFVEEASLQNFFKTAVPEVAAPAPSLPSQLGFLALSEASKRYGLSGDHIGRLCRSGKVRGVLAGNIWYVNDASLAEFVARSQEEQRQRALMLSEARKEEYAQQSAVAQSEDAQAAKFILMPRQKTSSAAAANASKKNSQAISESIPRSQDASHAATVPTKIAATVSALPQIISASKPVSLPQAIPTPHGEPELPARIATPEARVATPQTRPRALMGSALPRALASASSSHRVRSGSVLAVAFLLLFFGVNAREIGERGLGKFLSDLWNGPQLAPISMQTVPASTSTPSYQQIVNNNNTYNTTNNYYTNNHNVTNRNTYATITGGAGTGGFSGGNGSENGGGGSESGGVAITGGVSESELTQKLQALASALQSQFNGQLYTPGPVGNGGFTNEIAATQRIDQLNGTKLTNITVNGVTGLKAGEIPDLSATYLALAGGTLVGVVNNTTGATSTFSGPFSASVLTVSTTTATSTFGSGINMTSGCYAINGNCVASGSGVSAGGTNGQVQYNNSGVLAGASQLNWDNSGNALGVGSSSPYAQFSLHALASSTHTVLFSVASTTFYSTTTSATTTLFNILNTGFVGVASTSPWGLFSVNANATGSAPQFVVGSSSATNLVVANGGNVGVGTTSPFATLSLSGNFNETALPRASGSTPSFLMTAAADTGLATSTEASDVGFNLARTKTHSNGAIALQRDFLIQAATHAFATYQNGTNVITDLATLGLTGAPLTGANGTTTNAHTLYLGASALNASTTNSYGLTVNANTGAINNYAAQFLGGNVGIGTSSPFASFGVAGSGFFTGTLTGSIFSATTSATIASTTLTGNTLLTNATTTNLFATVASSTNLFAVTGTLGTLAVSGNSTLTGTLGVTGLATFGNASSTVLSVSGSASTTALTVSGTATFSSILANSMLYANSSDQIAAATIGNGLTFSAGTLALSFGTTTANTWTALQTFQNGFISQASSTIFTLNVPTSATIASTTLTGNTLLTNATTTNLFATVASSTNLFALSGNVTTLALGNALALSSGGTATTTFYNGGVVFSDGTKLTQASNSGNGAFFWDNTNNRLGIGTSTPWAQLSVNPSVIGAGPAFVIGSTTATKFIVDNAGNVGIGTTSPGTLFSINGSANFLNTATSTIYNGLSTTYLSLTGTSASSSAANGINITAGCFAISGACLGQSGSGVVGGSGSNNQVAYFSPNGSTLTSSSNFFFNGTSVGVGGTSTPWGLLSVNPNGLGASPAFVIGSSTATNFVVTNGGNVGFGYDSPQANIDVLVDNTGVTPGIRLRQSNVPTSRYWDQTLASNGGNEAVQYSVTNSGTSNYLLFLSQAGGAGIGNWSGLGNGYGANPDNFTVAATSSLNTVQQGITLTDNGIKRLLLEMTSSSTPISNSDAVQVLHLTSTGDLGLASRGSAASNIRFFTSSGSALSEVARITSAGNVGIGTTSPAQTFSVQGNTYHSGTSFFGGAITATSSLTMTEAARTSGSTAYFTLTGGADTGLSANTEVNDVNFSLNRTQTFSNGSISLQRNVLIQAPSYAFTSYASSNNILNAATLALTGAPITLVAGNGTTTNAHTLYLGASALNASTTNSYGLTVNANTGATNNYAAEFLGGAVGIASSSPFASLSVHNTASSTLTQLFAVGSTTLSGTTFSTSTLFSINNLGSTTLFEIPSTVLTTNANGTIVGTTSVGVAYGGTGATSYTAGSVIFAGANGTSLAQNNANFFWDNTNNRLGIGTSSPWRTLSVSASNNHPLVIADTSSGAYMDVTQGGAVFKMNAVGSTDLELTNGSNTSYISANLSGDLILSQNNSAAKNRFYVNSSGNGFRVGDTTDTNYLDFISGGVQSQWSASGNRPMKFTLNGTDVITMLAGGNVGVGTTTPFVSLDVASTSANSGSFGQLALTDTNGGANQKHWLLTSEKGNFYLATTSDSYATSSNNAFAINSNGQALFMDGNVGVGTTSPGSLLSLSGISNFTTATSTFYSSGGVNLTGGGCFAVSGNCLGQSGSGVVGGSGSNNQVAYFSPNGSTLTSSSNFFFNGTSVGVGGTSTPWGLLSVNPNAIGAGPAFVVGSSTATNFIVGSGGNVGIATTSPWGLLSVNPNAIGSNPEFVIGSSTATNFIVNNAGNVGIGTTSPTSSNGAVGRLVDIESGANTNVALTLSTNAISGSLVGSILEARDAIVGSGDARLGQLQWVRNTDVTNGKITSSFKLYTNNDGTLTDALDITAAGNVGIGTTSPWGLLSVNPNALGSNPEFVVGSSTATNFIVNNAGNVGIGTNNPAYPLDIQSPSSLGSSINLSQSGNVNSQINIYKVVGGNTVGGQINNSSGNLNLLSVGSARDIVFDTNTNSERMRIQDSTGNVSIGTTSIPATLTVNGLPNNSNDAINYHPLWVGPQYLTDTGGYLNSSTYNSMNIIASDSASSTQGLTNLLGWANMATATTKGTAAISGYLTDTHPAGTATGSGVAFDGESYFNNAASTNSIIDFYAFSAKKGSGTLTNMYDFYADAPSYNAGNLTNAYGLYVNNFGTNASTTYAIYTNGSTQSYFGGNVGIGTTSPGTLLDVNGLTEAANFNAYNFTATSSFNGGLIVAPGWSPSVNKPGLVGIGLANPVYQLEVANTTLPVQAGIESNSSTRSAQLFFGISLDGSVNFGNVGYDANLGGGSLALESTRTFSDMYLQTAASGNMYFQTGGANTRLTITSAGSVGIGTTSPYALASVFTGGDYASHAVSTVFAVGSTTAGTATTTLFAISSSAISSNQPLYLNSNGVLSATSSLSVNNGGTGNSSWTVNGVVYASASNALTNSSNLIWDGSRFYATSPSAQGASNGFESFSGATSTRLLTNASVGAYNSLTQAGDSMLIMDGTGVDTSDTPGLVIGPNSASAEGVRISSTGKVGIGSASSPDAQLSVRSTGQNAVVNIYGVAATTDWGAIQVSSTGNLSNSSNRALVLQPNAGNVGIGTTSPGTTLSVVGNGYLTGGLGVGVLNTTAGTLQTSSLITGGTTLTLSGTSGTTTLASGQGLTVGTSLFVVQQTSGNVGIGATNPSSRLTVSTNAATLPAPQSGTLATFANADGTAARVTLDAFAATGNLTLRRADTSAASPSAVQNTEGLGAISWFGYGTTGYSSATRAQINGVATQNWTDTSQGAALTFVTTPNGSTSNTEVMRIDQNGNVGIGTTSPNSLLTVSGAIPVLNIADTAASGDERIRLTDAGGNSYDITRSSVTGFLNFKGQQSGASGYDFSINNGTNVMRINNSGSVGIGTTSPAASLGVSGSIFSSGFFNTSGVSGGYKIDGNLILQASSTNSSTLVGISAGANLLASTTAAGNTAVGFQALLNATSSSYNTAVGYQALLGSATISNAGFNTALGYKALTTNTSGVRNTAAGYLALSTNISSDNTAFGYQALSTIGGNNNSTAIGSNALNKATGGSNTAIGSGAGGNTSGGQNNIYIGLNAGLNNDSGNFSTIVGTLAGWGNNEPTYSQTGDTFVGYGVQNNGGASVTSASVNNTAFGYEAYFNGTSGYNNLSLGGLSGQNLTSGSNNIAIGWNALLPSATANNQLSIANFIFGTNLTATTSGTSLPSTFTGNLGLATSTPQSTLSVSGNTSIGADYDFAAPTNGLIVEGNVGIGTTSPGSMLSVKSGLSVGADYGVLAPTNGAIIEGNVGIGDTSPGTTLAVKGVGQFYPSGVTPDNSYNGSLRVTQAAASGQYINLVRTGLFPWSIGTVYNANTFAIGQGQSTDSNFTSPFFNITTSGNVGIGTTSPAQLFSVSGNGYFTGGLGVGEVNTAANTVDVNQFGSYKQAGNTILYASSTVFTTLVGQAGAALTTGVKDVALGYQALNAATSTGLETAIGYKALQQDNAATGNAANFNTAVGAFAIQFATTSIDNTAVGYAALEGASASNGTNGTDNTALGFIALQLDTTGAGNTAVGSSALTNNSTGSSNIAIGYDALLNNTTASGNIGIGFQALSTATSGDRNIAIGFQSLALSPTGTNNVALGYDASRNNVSATSTVAIGYAAGQGASNFNAQGYTILGYFAGDNIITGADYNTLLGYQSGNGVTSGADNILIGASTDATSYNQITTGAQNIAIGYDIALPSQTANGQLDIGNFIYGTGLTGTDSTVSSGKIGIGTTSPWGFLSVNPNAIGSGPEFVVGSSTATNFIVTNAGNVGIGTANPSYPLAVIASAGGTGNVLFKNTSSTGFSGFDMVDNSGSAQGTIGYDNANAKTIINSTNNSLRLQIAGLDKVTLTNAGNVGIGTTTPGSNLSVQSGLSVGANYSVAAPSNGAIIQGNVSIGTTSAPTKLNVTGAGAGLAQIGDMGCGNNYAGIALELTVAPSGCTNYNLLGSPTDNTFYINAPSLIAYRTNNNDVMRMTSTGLAINGSASPSYALDVGGDINTASGNGYRQNGVYILRANGSATYNTFVGQSAGTASGFTGNTQTTALGFGALQTSTSTSYNTAIGVNALATAGDQTGTSGDQNVAVGTNALNANTGGQQNVAVGYGALTANTTASQNTAVGWQALTANTTGSLNTAIGLNAGLAVTTGRNNSFLGAQAANALTTGSNDVAVGYGALTTATSSNTDVAIGVLALASETAGGAAGNAHDNTAVGYAALNSNTYGYYNTATGFQVMNAVNTGIQNSGFGLQALFTATSSNNSSAFGMQALFNQANGNSGNADNDAFGVQSQQNTTYGYLNSSFGYQSLINNTTGNANTAMGPQAGYENTTGSNNTYMGYLAGYYDSSGAHTSITGSGNIIIGTNQNMIPTASASNQLNIGNLIFGTGLTGTNSVSTGDVGIGTTSPNSLLTVSGATPVLNIADTAASGDERIRLTDAGGNSYDITRSSVTGFLNFKGQQSGASGYDFSINNGTNVMRINNSGNLGIATTTPDAPLSIQSTISGASTPDFDITSAGSNFFKIYRLAAASTAEIQTGLNLALQPTSGNVGIAQASPSQKLDVNGNILVEGTGGTVYATSTFQAIARDTSVNCNYIGTSTSAMEEWIDGGQSSVNCGSAGLSGGVIQFAPLELNAAIPNQYQTQFFDTSIADNSALRWRNNSAGTWGDWFLFIAKDLVTGNTGIGTTTPWRSLDVNGTVGIKGLTSANTGDFLCLNTTTNEVTAGTTCTLSSQKLKNNIMPLATSSELAAIAQLQPVSFRYDPGFGDNGSSTQVGFIAEQAATINPLFAEYANAPIRTPNGTIEPGDPAGINWNAITSGLVGAVQELNLRTGFIVSAYGTSTVLLIDQQGNAGIGVATIGSSTLPYKLDVAGIVGAGGYVIDPAQMQASYGVSPAQGGVSTSASSTQATSGSALTLTEGDEDVALGLLASTTVAQFIGNGSHELFIRPSDVPREAQTITGGVDLYALESMTIAALKAEDRKVTQLQTTVSNLQLTVNALKDALATGTTAAVGAAGSSTLSAGSTVGSLGAALVNGVEYLASLAVDNLLTAHLTADNIAAENLAAQNVTVGSSQNPSGVTMFDSVTHQPYCFMLANGAPTTTPGACAQTASSTIEAAIQAASAGGATGTTSAAGATSGINNQPPVLSVNGNNPATLNVGDSYTDLGARITGPQADLNLGVSAILDRGATTTPGQIYIDTSKPGTHTIIYSATDQSGLTGHVSRTVNVIAPATASSTSPVATSTATTTP